MQKGTLRARCPGRGLFQGLPCLCEIHMDLTSLWKAGFFFLSPGPACTPGRPRPCLRVQSPMGEVCWSLDFENQLCHVFHSQSAYGVSTMHPALQQGIWSLPSFSLAGDRNDKDTDLLENGLEDTGRGKGKLGQSERVAWTYIHYQM